MSLPGVIIIAVRFLLFPVIVMILDPRLLTVISSAFLGMTICSVWIFPVNGAAGTARVMVCVCIKVK